MTILGGQFSTEMTSIIQESYISFLFEKIDFKVLSDRSLSPEITNRVLFTWCWLEVSPGNSYTLWKSPLSNIGTCKPVLCRTSDEG